MITSLGREESGEGKAERAAKMWQDGKMGSSQQEVFYLNLANAFLKQGHLIGLMLVPSGCYALFNPKLSLKNL